jgi:uncharacterized protein YqeY
MNLEEQINQDLKAAMLAKNEVAVRSLRAVKQAILIAKTSGGGGAITQEDEIKMLQKLVKQRKESAEIFQQQNRPELAKTETDEIAVIEKYLPQQMEESKVREEVKKIIEQVGAKSTADMGKVMGVASKQLAGKADN